MHPLGQAIWGDIWKHTVEKNHTNATSVTMHPLGQAIWGDIWRCTVEKSQTNATNVTLHPHRQTIWGHIWKHTVEKSQINARVWEQTNLKDFVHRLLSLLTVDGEGDLLVGVSLLQLPRDLRLPLLQHRHVERKRLVDFAQRFFVLTRQPGGGRTYKLCNA